MLIEESSGGPVQGPFGVAVSRFFWLAGLLMLQSLSSIVLEWHRELIQKHIVVRANSLSRLRLFFFFFLFFLQKGHLVLDDVGWRRRQRRRAGRSEHCSGHCGEEDCVSKAGV
jgi:hypothetical protein